MKIIDLVDSLEYTTTNCFAKQLHASLHRACPSIVTVPLDELQSHPPPDGIVCRLRSRTLLRRMSALSNNFSRVPFILYDQDPWEMLRDGSPYKGTYERAFAQLNLRSIAVTSEPWAQLIRDRGLPGSFVRMWMLPKLCVAGPSFKERSVRVGFIGSLHPYRARLFERLAKLGIEVQAQSGFDHPTYLRRLHDVAIYVHAEESPVIIDGVEHNLRDGLWGRSVEVSARGCFSIRNAGAGNEPYLQGNELVALYHDVDEVPEIIDWITNGYEDWEREALRQSTVDGIRSDDGWGETARKLIAALGLNT